MSKRLMGGRTETSPRLYKDLYKMYYNETWRTARVIFNVLGVVSLLIFIYLYSIGRNDIYMGLTLGFGIFCFVYPRNAYKRPYKRALSEKMSMHFTFYEDGMKEKINGESKTYPYKDMFTVIETSTYFYFFHTKNEVSVLEKENIIDGTPQELSDLLKGKVRKYKVKK